MSGLHPYTAGLPRPLGATVRDGGVNFSIFVDGANAAELLLYANASDEEPSQVIVLQHRHHRTVRCWHVFVAGTGAGQCYAWRIHGPWDPARALRFDPRIALLDPYTRLIVHRDGDESQPPAHGAARSGRYLSVVAEPVSQGGIAQCEAPVRPTERIVYEMHVRGFTRHSSCDVHEPGTYGALVEKIPYLVSLGITTIELMPIFAFDPHASEEVNPATGERVHDYWGYNPLAFFAPHPGYARQPAVPQQVADELRTLIGALHAAGLEVFLDVVFNHTGEGGPQGPTHSLRGISNHIYYINRHDGSGEYLDYTGCGNTLNCNHPAVRRMILDSLRFWTTNFCVDGFRFDLASVLSRDEVGAPLEEPPLLWEIEGDPTMERTTLIAEAWDAGGLYQVGRFPGERWCEWNGRYRDEIRRFWRGDPGMSGLVAQRVLGSPDMYESQGRQPSQCVNFVTCHDGFTLHDLVSYSRKHNLENGEQGRDGSDSEVCFNCGIEGETDDEAVNVLRHRQVRNLLTTLMVSQGTPMLLAGDEFGRTQRGNNNPWCQDNETSWLDWTLLETNRDLHRFVQTLIHFRRRHHSLHRSRYLLGHDAPEGHDTPGYTRVRWHGVAPDSPNWGAANRLLSWTLTPAADDVAIHIILNAQAQAVDVTLPSPPQGLGWLRVVDTSMASPDDIREPGHEEAIDTRMYCVGPQSAVVFIEEALGDHVVGRATQRIVLPPTLRQ